MDPGWMGGRRDHLGIAKINDWEADRRKHQNGLKKRRLDLSFSEESSQGLTATSTLSLPSYNVV